MKEESNQKALYWGLSKHSKAFFFLLLVQNKEHLKAGAQLTLPG